MVGGGVHGKVAGIAHIIITGVGLIITMFHVFIMTWTRVGDNTIENIIGMDIHGTMNEFLTDNFSETGETGVVIDIGKGKELGASRAINPDRNSRDRN